MTVTAALDAAKVGGLTTRERQKFFRLQRQLREAATNCYMRINDSDRRSFRARTLAAKKMAEVSSDIYKLIARTEMELGSQKARVHSRPVAHQPHRKR